MNEAKLRKINDQLYKISQDGYTDFAESLENEGAVQEVMELLANISCTASYLTLALVNRFPVKG